MIRSLRLFSGTFIVLIALVQTSEHMIRINVHAASHADDGDTQHSFAPLPTSLLNKDLRKLNQLDTAYLDAYTILRQENQCSRLYGGSGGVDALTDMVSQLKPVHIERSIAIRMSGRTTNFQSHRTGFSYRLFEKAEINLDGPFYGISAPAERQASLVSEFHSNTRASRVVALLHEVGHLVRGTDKKWLLPDDGADRGLSVKNSETVLQACHDEIASVVKMEVGEQVKQQNVDL